MTVAASTDSPPVRGSGHPAGLSTLALALLAGLVLVLVAGFLALVLTGHDTGTYVLFVAGPLVTTFTAAIVGHGVKRVEEVVKVVEAQTNGKLSASISDIHEHLDQQTEELLAAPTIAAPAARLPVQTPAPIVSRDSR